MLKRAHKIVVFINAIIDNVYNFLKTYYQKYTFFYKKNFS